MRALTISVAVALALLLAAACHLAYGVAEKDETLTVAVMSFNIRFGTARDGDNRWDNRKELVYDVIRQHSPDLVGLQEALRHQLDEIRKALPEYDEIGVGRGGGKKSEYSAILYRTKRFDVDASGTFWLSDTPDKPSRHWGNACIRICTWARFLEKESGRSFYVYNTHLDHKSQPSREKSIRLIMQYVQNRSFRDPFVLTGDFNAGESNPAILYLNGTGDTADRNPIPVVDSFRVLHPDAKDVGTFNGFAGRSNGSKIDYIFIEPSTRTLVASIVRTPKDGRYPSDHYPVTATLQFKMDRKTNSESGNSAPNKSAESDGPKPAP